MQLPVQLLKQLRILTDKPISVKVNKQLYALLLHQNLNIQKTISLLCLKHRCDLLIYILQNNRYPNQKIIDSMLSSIITNVLEYKIPQILQLYILILTKIEDDKRILQIGYYDLIKLAIKQPNSQIKQAFFKIIVSNSEYLYKRKCKKIIMAIVQNYLDVFIKFMIYVPSYISLIQLSLQIDRNSKKIINKQHPQKQPILEEIFIDLSSQQLSQIKNQLLTILQNTKQKLNYYSLHRNCLNALKKIGDLLNDFKIKESQLYFTQLQVGKICRTIQKFLDRKGTIDQARFAKTAWNHRFNQLKKIKQFKTQKFINPANNPSLLLDQKYSQKPLLIEQVISMANNYRLKYQVQPLQNQQTPTKIINVSNNFLKKGIGIGGGRTNLLNKQHQSVFQQQKNKNKRLYEDIVDKCFSQTQKEFQYKSFIDPKFYVEEPICFNSNYQQGLIQQNQILKESQIEEKLKQVPILFQNYKSYQQMNQARSMTGSSLIQDDQQMQQISNLIDLAYSYKFS